MFQLISNVVDLWNELDNSSRLSQRISVERKIGLLGIACQFVVVLNTII